MGLLDFLKETIGIDPGSQYLRVIKDEQIIFNEQSQISINKIKSVLTGLGDSIGTTANDITIKPVNCVIADFQGFEMLLRGAIKKSTNSRGILPPSYIMYFSIPTSTTEIEKRAYRDSAEHSGAIEVHMVYQSCCSAIGMNILFEKKHFILIDFSASKIEMIVFANSLIMSDGVLRLGTWKIFRLLKNYIRRKHNIEMNDNEIEDMLISIDKNAAKEEVVIQHTTIKTKDIQDLLGNFFSLVNDEFIETLERVSNHPDMAKILTNGIYFTGGGATFNFLIDQIKLDNRIKRNISQNPFLDNINGLKELMANKAKFKDYIMV